MKNKLIKKQLRMCLKCQIGAVIITDYKNIKETIKKEDNYNSNKYDKPYEFDDEDEENINLVADSLKLEGTLKEKYEILKRLSKGKAFEPEDEPISSCLANLQRIIQAIHFIYEDENKESAIELHNIAAFVYSSMHELNKTQGKYTSKKTQGKYTSKKIEKAEIALKLFKKKNNTEKEERMDEIYDGLKNIFIQYCLPSISSNEYYINEPETCRRKLFLDTVKKMIEAQIPEDEYINIKEKNMFFNRVDKLPCKLQEIISTYMIYAPKRFGHCLKAVMEEQNMSEANIVSLFESSKKSKANEENKLKKNTYTTSIIQSLTKTAVPQMKPDDISRMSKALLVSEDVLYKGIGKKYGNWQDLFNSDNLAIIEKSTNLTGKRSVQNFIKAEIKNLTKLDETEFQKLVQENPDLFLEEDFCVFSDWKECYDSLLHKDELFALLEALEKMNM